MVLDSEMKTTKEFFESHFIKLCEFWLEHCVQWFREQNQNYSETVLHTQVYEQWLLLDLRDVDVPILPPNLKDVVQKELSGNYSLQLLSVVDIAKPKYWQLNNIRNKKKMIKTESDESVGTGKRTLLLTLTDGIQEIKAMEFHPISQLNLNLTPGMKVRIKGPVIVRRGRILLKENNIKLLGGEVEDLLVSNAAENVLAQALNLPINANPSSVSEEINENITQSTQISNVSYPTQNSNIGNRQNINIGNRQNVNVSNRQHSSNLGNKSLQQTNFNNTNNSNMSAKNSRTNLRNENIQFEEDDDELFLAAEEMATKSQEHNEGSKLRSVTPDLFDELDLDEEEFRNIELIAPSTSSGVTPEKSLNNKVIDRSLRLVCELEELKNAVTKGKFKTHARFKTVSQKLFVEDDSWCIKIVVEDDTGELETTLDSNLISSMIGYTPSEVSRLKNNIASQDSASVGIVMKALSSFKEKLIGMDCAMEILFEKGKDPCILKISN